MQDPSEDSNADAQSQVYQRLGGITRQLHDALKELGHADRLKGTVDQLPDTKSRLSYIARLTGEAAEKVLNQVDEAKEEQAQIALRARKLVETLSGVPGLVTAMPELLLWSKEVVQASDRIDTRLTEIMLAQDFHDLTGQVIGRVVQLAATIESQLLDLLLHSSPGGKPGEDKAVSPTLELDGPVVDREGRPDVVNDQAQVDDLLASLGF
ncbi:chemotaxis protein CheZ [Hydrogenophaga crassostreae]|uniref:Protein phosphatase CheZ n=1 Tax=Hydrogenophaga crassostreae TaxID=1763535 RepID=A0A163CD32_9BURK|nr:protein phosphatase CheZ [Hydrogenophaga crassostreae]AOW15369.1 chemotaxis protein CheZ [Hydrogenophaga crassostreae]OAD41326.1 chemotaxis protein CheZ [Hydrogenophaga crassostreae]